VNSRRADDDVSGFGKPVENLISVLLTNGYAPAMDGSCFDLVTTVR